MADAFQSDSFQIEPLAFQYTIPGGETWPDPADVRYGVMYGPTGVEYTGTLIVTPSGGTVWMRIR